MNTEKNTADRPARGLGWGKTAALALPMLALTWLMQTGGPTLPTDPLRLAPLLVVWALLNVLFVLMLRTGRTDRFRAALFVTVAVAFVFTFISNLVEMRGSMAISEEDMLHCQTPFCHMVIPMTLVPAALTRTIIFPGRILGDFAPIAGMFALWIGASLALGRGWCSWGCFFGGLEDGFSRLRKKPLLRSIDRRWTFLPYAVLLGAVLSSALLLRSTYCEWLCPFKTVTEYAEVNSALTAVQAGIFLSLFAGLVVVLPVLTKRRTQCGLFCPFGAFQSGANWVGAVDVRVDRDACTKCGRCTEACPTFSLDEAGLEKGRPRISCSRCGKCVDVCPQKAVSYHVRGTPGAARPATARLLFLFPAFLFLSTMGGGMIQDALYRLLRLVTTGSVLH